MTTYYGVNATKRDNSTIPSLEAQGEKGGRVRMAYDYYVMDAAKSAADVIRMMKLPPKARVVGWWVAWSASLDASGGTMDVGWEANGSDSADTDGFADGLDVTSAGQYSMPSGTSTKLAGLFKQFAEKETQISITVATEWDQTSGTIELAVFYVID